MSTITIGGAPVITLTAPPMDGAGPQLVSADIIPGRGMMLLQLKAKGPDGDVFDLIASPSLDDAARRLNGDELTESSPAFAFGGAILAPFANRIRGAAIGDGGIGIVVLDDIIRLHANWGGKAVGAERYAMHGLILESAPRLLSHSTDRAAATIISSDFSGAWPGKLELAIEWRLSPQRLRLRLTATNAGDEPSPVGLGWHPYFRIPSGQRDQARLTLPAHSRALVNNYDEVLPTGEVEAVAGTPYDFRTGKALGDLYLDDCFLELDRADGSIVIQIEDPASRLTIDVRSPSPAVKAIQTYAPPSEAFVVVEPQFNLANPFGEEWGDQDTGMVILEPGEKTTYETSVSLHESAHG